MLPTPPEDEGQPHVQQLNRSQLTNRPVWFYGKLATAAPGVASVLLLTLLLQAPQSRAGWCHCGLVLWHYNIFSRCVCNKTVLRIIYTRWESNSWPGWFLANNVEE